MILWLYVLESWRDGGGQGPEQRLLVAEDAICRLASRLHTGVAVLAEQGGSVDLYWSV